MKTYLIFMEVKYGAIDVDNYSCHGCYIIKFPSFPYTLQAYLIIGGKVISPVKLVCEWTYFFAINTNYNYYVLQK